MAGQVWDVVRSGSRRSSVVRGSDGRVRMVTLLSDDDVGALVLGGHLRPRHGDACQDPAEDLLRPSQRLRRRPQHRRLRAI